MPDKQDSADTVVIKKYANRRLYDTTSSQYVTLDYVRELVKDGREFTVVDAKSGEDLTHSVLSQIIFEEEARGANLLPLPFLRQLIQYYGDSLQSVVPSYLEATMTAFTQQQEEMRERFSGSMVTPQAMMEAFQEQTRRNMEMFGQAMQLFSPYSPSEPEAPKAAPSEDSEALKAMQAELDAMQAKIDSLSKK